jgi:hypothetical protein
MQAFRQPGYESVYYYLPLTGGEAHEDDIVNEFYRDYTLLPRLYLYEKMVRNLEIIKYVAQAKGIKVYVSSWCGLEAVIEPLDDQNELGHVTLPWIDHYGRDGRHPGCSWHNQVTDQFEQAIRANQ